MSSKLLRRDPDHRKRVWTKHFFRHLAIPGMLREKKEYEDAVQAHRQIELVKSREKHTHTWTSLSDGLWCSCLPLDTRLTHLDIAIMDKWILDGGTTGDFDEKKRPIMVRKPYQGVIHVLELRRIVAFAPAETPVQVPTEAISDSPGYIIGFDEGRLLPGTD